MSKERIPGITRKLTMRENMWIKNFRAHETPASLELADNFIKLLGPNDKILEVGCAWGRWASILLTGANNRSYVGIDINNAEIEGNNKIINDSRMKFYLMDGAQLAFGSENFDNIIMVGVIGGVELEVRKMLLKEAFRVLKPGGKLAIAEFKINTGNLLQYAKYIEDEKITEEWGTRIVMKNNKELFIGKHFEDDELIKLLSNTGFSSIEIKEQTIETPGIGDCIIEKRQQLTVWGVKPLTG